MPAQPALPRNRVFKKDVIDVLRALPDGSLDMIYGDPDYGVGINYAGKRYTKKWSEYIEWYERLASECMRVLHPRGNLFLMNYPKQNAHLRARYLDDAAHDVRDYVWVYPTNVGHSRRYFTTAHRSILHATKSARNKFYKAQVAQPYKNPEDRRIKARIAAGHLGRMPYSWFEFNLVKNVSRDKTFHACQIPLSLFEMLTNAATKKGDMVMILFGGSGSEIVKARDMGRDYLSCEIHKPYHRMIQERLKDGGRISGRHRLPCYEKSKHSVSSSEGRQMNMKKSRRNLREKSRETTLI